MAQAKVRTPLHQGKINHFLPRNDDSPSRQLQFEVERAMSQIQLHQTECQKVYAFERRAVRESLDAKEQELARLHEADIEESAAKHRILQQEAVELLNAHRREVEEARRRAEEERERIRKEEEARQKAEDQRRQKEEQERKEREARAKAEKEAKLQREQEKAAEEERRRKEREDTARREQEAKDAAAADAAAQVAVAKQKEEALKATEKAQAQLAQPAKGGQDTLDSLSSSPEVQHKQYLRIHRDLKTFRKDFWESAKKNPNLKPHVGEMRRALRTSVGQLTDDKAGNKQAVERIKSVLFRALREIPSPPIILNDYLPPHLKLLDNNTTTIPSLLLYLMSILTKAIINAFVGEGSVNTKAAEPIGNMVAQVFSLSELQFPRHPSADPANSNQANGQSSSKPATVSLISILMCKFHAQAPILFGVSGDEKTQTGKLRLGWRREEVPGADGKAFVLEQKQYDRLIGLGAGYAAIALRNFSRARLTNPWPPVHFWESFAYIVNTNPTEVQTSHLLLLKNMLENSVDRFVLFFGAAAIAALREALIEFPKRLPQDIAQKPAAKALTLLAESFQNEKHFRLT